jgi:hypothetical protein
MPYTNVEKGTKSFLKMFGTTEFYKKNGSKKSYWTFLLSFNPKSSHFDKNISLNLNVLNVFHQPGEYRYGFDLWRSPWSFGTSTENIR